MRYSRDAEFRLALLEAASVFASTDKAAVLAHSDNFYLPAADGAFASQLILGKLKDGEKMLYARARTYYSDDMLGDRIPLPPAISADRSVAHMLLIKVIRDRLPRSLMS